MERQGRKAKNNILSIIALTIKSKQWAYIAWSGQQHDITLNNFCLRVLNLTLKDLYIPNPFILNVPFLYSLETSENRKVFWCF